MQKITSPLFQQTASLSQRFPLAVYLTFGIGFSWLVWLAAGPVASLDPTAFRHLVAIGAFSPSLAALVLRLINSASPARFRWDIFVAALFGTGILYILCLPFASSLPNDATSWGWAYRFALWALPAFLISAALSGQGDLRRLLLPGRTQTSDGLWYAAALLVAPILMGIGYLLGLQSGESAALQIRGGFGQVALTIAAVFIYVLLFGGPLSEESGLRGFLLPTLQARWSPLIATLLIGLGWAAWRLPLYVNGYYQPGPDGFLVGILNRSLFNVLSAFPLTWIYNRSRGNVLACVLLHTAVTAAAVFLPVSIPSLALLAVLALGLILEAKMWRSPSQANHLQAVDMNS